MKFNRTLVLILLTIPFWGTAQKKDITLLVQPYLQDASPNSIKVLWETSSGEESMVEWGLTPKLGKKSKGISFDINFSESRIHEVKIEGLKRFTEYYYRVKTGKARSDVFQFKTPPFAEDNESFRLVAMSDMQYDHNEPDKFSEVVNQGILEYFKKEFEGNLPKNLAMVLVPGDLVENGAKYYQWKDHFFNPAEKLFTQVPLYPVPGNHERNSVFYFKYFSLPENGTPAYAEHWWYKDYGNTRIIGLNSNAHYRNSSEQKKWLEELLEETAKEDQIDFVFAQLHHPHKSELWIPGEEDFSGVVVKALENSRQKVANQAFTFLDILMVILADNPGTTNIYGLMWPLQVEQLIIGVSSKEGTMRNFQ